MNTLFQFLADAVEEIDTECTRAELVICAGRLFQAIAVIQQATTTQFLMLARAQIAEREDRYYGRLLVIMVVVIVTAGFVLGIIANLITGSGS